MQSFVDHENIVRYRRLIAVAEADPSRNEARYQMLLRLLAEEVAKEVRSQSATCSTHRAGPISG